MAAHTYSPRAQETEAGGLMHIWGQPGYTGGTMGYIARPGLKTDKQRNKLEYDLQLYNSETPWIRCVYPSQRPETEKLLFLNLQHSISPGHFEITEIWLFKVCFKSGGKR